MRYALLVLLLSLTGCPASCQTPTPTPSADAGEPAADSGAPVPSSDVDAVCANLARLGCPEGTPRCAEVLRRAVDSRITTFRLDCLSSASSQAEVRGCGGVRCSP